MKVLWISDGGSHTGFARVTHNIGDRLARDFDYDISVLAINHRGDYWDTPMKLYVPTLRNVQDIYGMSRIVEMLDLVDPDVVVMVNDPAVVVKYLFNNAWDTERMLLGYRPILAYMPIDGYQQPPGWDILKNVTKRVAMTTFGQTAMPEAPVVYHGVETDTYYPVKERPITVSNGKVLKTKADCKRELGFDPQGFLVLRVDRNSFRKNYPDTIKAVWDLAAKHADVQVHLHCEQRDSTGYNLPHMLNRKTDLKPRFFFPESMDSFMGWPDADLCALYNAADVFISTSWGEGFGLTLAEAASCGVPIIAQDVSAITEVVGPGGLLIAPQRETTTPSGQEQWLPDVAAFSAALEELYADANLRRRLGEAGREHVKRSFSWDDAAGRFHDFIVELAKPSDPQEEVTSGNDKVHHLLRAPQGV